MELISTLLLVGRSQFIASLLTCLESMHLHVRQWLFQQGTVRSGHARSLVFCGHIFPSLLTWLESMHCVHVRGCLSRQLFIQTLQDLVSFVAVVHTCINYYMYIYTCMYLLNSISTYLVRYWPV